MTDNVPISEIAVPRRERSTRVGVALLVLGMISTPVLAGLVLRSEEAQTDSIEEQNRLIRAESLERQRYTRCLVVRALGGVPIPPENAPCPEPTAEEIAAARSEGSGGVELIAVLARCLEPGASAAEREACVRGALAPPTPTTTVPPPSPPSTTVPDPPRAAPARDRPPEAGATAPAPVAFRGVLVVLPTPLPPLVLPIPPIPPAPPLPH